MSMDPKDALAIATGVMGTVMAVAPLLQLRRIITIRSGEEVSATFLGIISFGAFLYGLYGVALGELALIVPNFIGAAVNLTTAGVAMYFRDPRVGGATGLRRPVDR